MPTRHKPGIAYPAFPGIAYPVLKGIIPGMVKKKDHARTLLVMRSLEQMTAPRPMPASAEDEILDFTSLGNQPVKMVADSAKSLRMKKFRTQLLYQWLANVFEPARVADVGGGKGLLSFLLINSGWQAAVIDPLTRRCPTNIRIYPTDSG